MKIAVIGAGFAGLVAASLLKKRGLDFVLYEREKRAGKKLLATGNGRCNITNENIDIKRYHGNKKFISSVIEKYGKDDLLDFFKSIGLSFTKEDDRIYPSSLQASSVLDLLRLAEGQSERCSAAAEKIIPHKNCLGVVEDGHEEKFDRVIVCTGGAASPKLSGGGDYSLLTNLGHRLTPLSPSIVQLKCAGTKPLEGIKVLGNITVGDRSETGEILFTSYGLSGPPVMQLSRNAKGKKAKIDLAPNFSFSEILSVLEQKRSLSYITLENLFTGFLNKKVGMQILKRVGALPFSRPASELSERELKSAASLVKNFDFDITDTAGFENAQVTAGGIDLADFDENTMESKLVKGVYAAGEILDADGDCGGFNLQWAFSSAYLAAISASRDFKDTL